jgi:hypothetical protein
MTATKTTSFQDTARSHMEVLAAVVVAGLQVLTRGLRLYAQDMNGRGHAFGTAINGSALTFIHAPRPTQHITAIQQWAAVEAALPAIFG